MYIPVSITEEGALFGHELAESHAVALSPHFLYIALHFLGRLDYAILTKSLKELVDRHEALRAAFVPNPLIPPEVRASLLQEYAKTGLFARGVYLQQIKRRAELEITRRDVSHFDEAPKYAEIVRICRGEIRRPMSFGKPPLARVCLIKAQDCEHILLLIIHHFIADAISMRLAANDLKGLYHYLAGSKQSTPFPPLMSYSRFVKLQHADQYTSRFRSHLNYWRDQWNQFAGGRITFEDLPFSRPPADPQTFTYGTEQLAIDQGSLKELKESARYHRVSLHDLFLTAYAILLHAVTLKPKVAIWGHFANRASPETRRIIGPLSTTHIIGLDLSRDICGEELLHQVRNVMSNAIAHQELPLQEMWQQLRCYPRHKGVYVLLDSYRSFPREPVSGRVVTIRRFPLPPLNQPRFADLGVYVFDRPHDSEIQVPS
jgi:hypothetical protein